jgi:hypothetical protein
MEQYGILSPVLGLQEAMPSILLNDANFPEMTNARFYNGEVWRVRGRAAELVDGDNVKVQAPDGNPIIHYHYYLKRQTSSAYLLVFTKDHIYYWWPDGYGIETPDWEAGESYSKRDFVIHDGTTYWCLESHTSIDFDTDLDPTTAPDWATETAYVVGNLIKQGGSYYRCISAHTSDVFAYDLDPEDIDAWQTSTDYEIGDYVEESGNYYICLEAHTSGTFSTDLADEKWELKDMEARWEEETPTVKWEVKEKSQYLEIFECSSSCDVWSTADYNDKIIATNNVDLVQEWGGDTSVGPTALDDTTNGIEYGSGIYLTAAKYVTAFKNFLILGYTTENGVIYRKRIRWNDVGDESAWNSGDAGSAELPGDDNITGFAKRQDRLFTFKQDSIIQLWAVSTDLVFNSAIYSPNYGCPAPKSIVETPEGQIFYYASDRTFKELDGTEISKPVNKTITQIPADLTESIEGKYSWDNRVVLWAYPEGPVDENNRVFSYDHLANRWGKESKHVNAFGEYKSGAVAYTWATLPYETWLTWDWDQWMWAGGQEGVPVLLSGDSSGYTFSYYGGESDDGASYTGYFVLSTDLRQGETLSFYKRLLFMQLYFRKEATEGTITVEIKTDTEPNWTSAGSITLAGTEDILIKTLPVDSRGKTFQIKFSGSSRFRFVGAIFEYERIGGR